MASLQLRAGIQSPPTIALKTIMQMLPIPCYFPRNGRRAPCGRSNCFPVMWKTNQEKEGRECERKIATHPLAGLGDACNDPTGADSRGQSPSSEPRKWIPQTVGHFPCVLPRDKAAKGWQLPFSWKAPLQRERWMSGSFGEDGQDIIWSWLRFFQFHISVTE